MNVATTKKHEKKDWQPPGLLLRKLLIKRLTQNTANSRADGTQHHHGDLGQLT